MRASIPLLLVLSKLISLGKSHQDAEVAAREDMSLLENAARVEDLESRAPQTDDEDRPRYSTVPLFPGEDDEDETGDGNDPDNGSGGGDDETGDGGDDHQGDDDGDGVVTFIRTVTDDPVTKILTHTVPDVETETVTKALPTTKTVVSVIDMDDDITTTVYVTHTPEPMPPPPPPPAPEPTTVFITEEPFTSTTIISTPSSSSTPSPSSTSSTPIPSSVSTPTWQPSVTLPDLTNTPRPTTFVTSIKSSSSQTFDDGQWPVTKSYDNGQWHTIYPPWNATDSSRWRRIR